MNAVDISLTGLDVEWRRMEVIAQNLANANTTRTALGEPYRAMRLVSGPRLEFNERMTQAREALSAGGVVAYGVEPIQTEPRRVYEPAHPHADEEGYVTYPGFDHASEMVLLMQTSRVYEANVVALNIARQMYAKAMEIGRR
jgi:flagellar basal-body rod protein FlgC